MGWTGKSLDADMRMGESGITVHPLSSTGRDFPNRDSRFEPLNRNKASPVVHLKPVTKAPEDWRSPKPGGHVGGPFSLHFSPQAQNNGVVSERGCVVLEQPQRLDRARRLRLVFDTAALRRDMQVGRESVLDCGSPLPLSTQGAMGSGGALSASPLKGEGLGTRGGLSHAASSRRLRASQRQ
jgi:hypothetical protein